MAIFMGQVNSHTAISIKTVGVIGLGKMGQGIADIMALNDMDVIVTDISKELIEKGVYGVDRMLDDLVNFHKTKAEHEIKRIEENDGISLNEDQKARIREHLRPSYDEKMKTEALDRIKSTLRWDDLRNVDLIIEAVFEDINVKKKTFRELDKICSTQTMLATNTSTLSITEIASVTKRPPQVLGMHFFVPPVMMQLVEVIPGLETSEVITEGIMEFVSGLKNHRGPMQPVRVEETPAFLVNRILMPALDAAYDIHGEGIASMKDIDVAMKLGAGWPLGPFELSDLIGIDVIHDISRSIKEQTRGISPVVRKMYHAGRLGRKTGRGFYDYRKVEK
jgi:3-hydroxybutyryl-CoA dehydrogenase